MLVLSRKPLEAVVVGGGDGIERLVKRHSAGDQARQRETWFRGTGRRSRPSLGGLGTHPKQWPAQHACYRSRTISCVVIPGGRCLSGFSTHSGLMFVLHKRSFCNVSKNLVLGCACRRVLFGARHH